MTKFMPGAHELLRFVGRCTQAYKAAVVHNSIKAERVNQPGCGLEIYSPLFDDIERVAGSICFGCISSHPYYKLAQIESPSSWWAYFRWIISDAVMEMVRRKV